MKMFSTNTTGKSEESEGSKEPNNRIPAKKDFRLSKGRGIWVKVSNGVLFLIYFFLKYPLTFRFVFFEVSNLFLTQHLHYNL